MKKAVAVLAMIVGALFLGGSTAPAQLVIGQPRFLVTGTSADGNTFDGTFQIDHFEKHRSRVLAVGHLIDRSESWSTYYDRSRPSVDTNLDYTLGTDQFDASRYSGSTNATAGGSVSGSSGSLGYSAYGSTGLSTPSGTPSNSSYSSSNLGSGSVPDTVVFHDNLNNLSIGTTAAGTSAWLWEDGTATNGYSSLDEPMSDRSASSNGTTDYYGATGQYGITDDNSTTYYNGTSTGNGMSSGATIGNSGNSSLGDVYYTNPLDYDSVTVLGVSTTGTEVRLPVEFTGTSCDGLHLSIGPANGSIDGMTIKAMNSLNSSGSSVGTNRIVFDLNNSNTVGQGVDNSFCLISSLVNGKGSTAVIVQELNKLIGWTGSTSTMQ